MKATSTTAGLAQSKSTLGSYTRFRYQKSQRNLLKAQTLYGAAASSPGGLAMLATSEQTKPWRMYQHLSQLNLALLKLAAGQCPRLMVFMPPQHGKSSLISHHFPAWYLGKNPDAHVILGSYEGDFAARWGRRARDVLEKWGPSLFGVRVDPRSSAAAEWSIADHPGGMVCAGRGQGITGRPANILIIDDPLKDAQEANSATIRDQLWDWYRTVAYTRLATGGAIIWVQTRWHEDDGAGRLLAEMRDGGEHWEVLKFQSGLAETPPVPLCPDLHSLKELQAARRTLGGYYWHALYEQEPQPAGGDVFKRDWFRYWWEDGESYVLVSPSGHETRVAKLHCPVFQTCDPAATSKDSNDWFCITTWAYTPGGDLLVIDVRREHAETTQHRAIMQQEWIKHRPEVQGVENKTFGLNIIQDCLLIGLPIVSLKADTDKVSRSRPAAARYENGKVYHKRGAPWLDALEAELVGFPRAKHDDQVDTVSYAAILLAERAVMAAARPNYMVLEPVRI